MYCLSLQDDGSLSLYCFVFQDGGCLSLPCIVCIPGWQVFVTAMYCLYSRMAGICHCHVLSVFQDGGCLSLPCIVCIPGWRVFVTAMYCLYSRMADVCHCHVLSVFQDGGCLSLPCIVCIPGWRMFVTAMYCLYSRMAGICHCHVLSVFQDGACLSLPCIVCIPGWRMFVTAMYCLYSRMAGVCHCHVLSVFQDGGCLSLPCIVCIPGWRVFVTAMYCLYSRMAGVCHCHVLFVFQDGGCLSLPCIVCIPGWRVFVTAMYCLYSRMADVCHCHVLSVFQDGGCLSLPCIVCIPGWRMFATRWTPPRKRSVPSTMPALWSAVSTGTLRTRPRPPPPPRCGVLRVRDATSREGRRQGWLWPSSSCCSSWARSWPSWPAPICATAGRVTSQAAGAPGSSRPNPGCPRVTLGPAYDCRAPSSPRTTSWSYVWTYVRWPSRAPWISISTAAGPQITWSCMWTGWPSASRRCLYATRRVVISSLFTDMWRYLSTSSGCCIWTTSSARGATIASGLPTSVENYSTIFADSTTALIRTPLDPQGKGWFSVFCVLCEFGWCVAVFVNINMRWIHSILRRRGGNSLSRIENRGGGCLAGCLVGVWGLYRCISNYCSVYLPNNVYLKYQIRHCIF